MKKLISVIAIAALLSGTSLQAAQDTGLMLNDSGIGQRNIGVGVTAGFKIKLGTNKLIKQSERIKFGINAGPVSVSPDAKRAGGLFRTDPALVGLEIRPGFSTKLNFAGQPMLADYTVLGAAENEDNDRQSTGDKIAWVAAVAGGVMVLLVGAATIALMTECYECED